MIKTERTEVSTISNQTLSENIHHRWHRVSNQCARRNLSRRMQEC